MKLSRKIVSIILVLALVLSTCSISFAEEKATDNVPIDNNSIEFDLSTQELQENGSAEIVIVQKSDGTLKAIDESNSSTNTLSSKSIVVECKVKVKSWDDDYVTLGISAKSTYGKMKGVTGDISVTNASSLNPVELSSFDFKLWNKAGTTALSNTYSSWVGSQDEIRIVMTNLLATDINGDVGSLAQYKSPIFERP